MMTDFFNLFAGLDDAAPDKPAGMQRVMDGELESVSFIFMSPYVPSTKQMHQSLESHITHLSDVK